MCKCCSAPPISFRVAVYLTALSSLPFEHHFDHVLGLQASEVGSDEAADEDFNNQLISIQQQLHVEEVVRNSDAKGEQYSTLYQI